MDPGVDPYGTVVDLVTAAARASASADVRLEAISDLLTERTGSTVGLMVHGAPDGYAVGVVGQASPSTQVRMTAEMAHAAGPDPLLDRIRSGHLEPTTAVRAYGSPQAWLTSAKCLGTVDIWGVDQVAALPVRPGTEFVVFFVGRLGEDYDEGDLSLLRAVQPVVAALAQLLEPEHLSSRGPTPTLTHREREVLELLALGHKASTIARHAGCSERTVHRHLSNIYAKLEVGDRLTAVTSAYRLGLLTDVPSAMRDG